jgi:hypothetical protein
MAKTGPRNPFMTLASVALFSVAALMIWRAPHPLDTTAGWTRVAAPIAEGVGLLKAADARDPE